jgi:CubicO group peptidase (beta-lactamase class C family)
MVLANLPLVQIAKHLNGLRSISLIFPERCIQIDKFNFLQFLPAPMHRRGFLNICAQSAIVGTTFNISCSQKDRTSTFDPAQIDKLITGWIAEFKVPGVSIAVIQNGATVWNKAFGVRNTTTKEPVDVDTLFEAASVSKTVFAYAVMKLVETNEITLNSPLSDYYPELFAEGDPRLKLITARQVLSHTTGLPDWRPETPVPFRFDPGKGFEYSGEGYFLLQTVVSKLKGKMLNEPCGTYEADLKVCATDIASYMKKNVLIPNGMNSSTYEIDYTTARNAAIPHDGENRPYSKRASNPAEFARYASAGGLMTNAKEYSKFLINLFEAKESDPFRLNASSLAEMFRPQSKLPEGQEIDGCTQWALGWGIKDLPTGRLILHSGGQQGIRSLTMASVEKKTGFIALTNGDNGAHVVHRVAEFLTPVLMATI